MGDGEAYRDSQASCRGGNDTVSGHDARRLVPLHAAVIAGVQQADTDNGSTPALLERVSDERSDPCSQILVALIGGMKLIGADQFGCVGQPAFGDRVNERATDRLDLMTDGIPDI